MAHESAQNRRDLSNPGNRPDRERVTPVAPLASSRPGRARSVAVLGAVALLVAVVLAVLTARQGPDCGLGDDGPRTRPSLGVTVAGFPADDTELRRLASGLQRRPDVVMWYDAWSSGADFPADAAAQVRRLGAVPEITWEPWDPAAGPDQQTYPLPGIAAGDHDEYVARWAGQVVDYGLPVRLRFAHEMNADIYPWSEVDGRNPPGSYVAAWRHVRDVFDDAGADNVTWVWSPNTPYPGTTPLADLYPGDDEVDARWPSTATTGRRSVRTWGGRASGRSSVPASRSWPG
jgi:hypothetical protein